ncbi:Bacterial DnaG primase, TOPRIM domain [uncultured Caudovirales phage]|uniref:Bacterial DnaG primase, TOPRIM domain n=1 Tax=uncultured Caudovirales phage TaxID=2100421 RepID=A0A6J5KUM1_9CAUD|nr:Bacterial DnaG primase, TOPRIM domain [uncultured Caudovirales phage]
MVIDVEAVLTALGIPVEIKGYEALGLCPMHEQRTGKEDRSPSWWINMESGMHTCFSCHYKGNALQLICDIKEFYIESWGTDRLYDYKAAEEWLKTVSEIDPERMLEIIRSLPAYIEAMPKPVEMSEARLAIFVPPTDEALKSRNITAEAAAKFGVMWDLNKKNWVLPIREPHFNKLMGWQEKGTVDRTFMNRPPGLQKSKTLFGIENQQEDYVIIVESPLDCVRVATAGYTSVVAICGSSVSDEQIKLIRYSDKVICAFDNPNLDKAGKKASDEMRIYARKYGLNLFFFNYGDSNKKDPGDMTNEEISRGIITAKSSILGELAYVYGDTKTVSS